MKKVLSRPILTVDVVLLRIEGEIIKVGLQPRAAPPHKDRHALIGGYIWPEIDQSAEHAALRALDQKAGVQPRRIEQLMTFSGPARDPRGWSASVAYIGLTTPCLEPQARDLVWIPASQARALPFDHHDIIACALTRLRRRAAYSTLPAFFLPPAFSLGQLRAAYEVALGRRLNDSAFRRKISELRVLVSVEGEKSRQTDRPAQLYQLAHPEVCEFDRTL